MERVDDLFISFCLYVSRYPDAYRWDRDVHSLVLDLGVVRNCARGMICRDLCTSSLGAELNAMRAVTFSLLNGLCLVGKRAYAKIVAGTFYTTRLGLRG